MHLDAAGSLLAKLSLFVRRLTMRRIRSRAARHHIRAYLEGLLSDLPRKHVAAIAQRAGLPERTLQGWLQLGVWPEDQVRARLQQLVAQEHADADAIAVLDETSFAKQGDTTAGVQRQYCGATGKQDNCVVTVHLGYVTDRLHVLIDGDLYLPKETWAEDPARRQRAGIPDDVVYRPKWRIGLDLLGRVQQQGVGLRWLTADEAYGCGADFRHGVVDAGVDYVVEVPQCQRGWSKAPPLQTQPQPLGRPRTRPALAAHAPAAREVRHLWHRGGPSWQAFHVKDTDKGPVVWEVRACRFWPSEDSLPGPEQWLLIGRMALTGERQYFLSSAPADTPLATLVRVAFSRWYVEGLFKAAKGEVGLDHFIVRYYRPLMRHVVLAMVALFYLALQAPGRRKRRLVVEPVADPSGAGGTAGPLSVAGALAPQAA